MAGSSGLEPAASGVTGRRSNQLNYDPKMMNYDPKMNNLSDGLTTFSVPVSD
jgi:hypothetical protein